MTQRIQHQCRRDGGAAVLSVGSAGHVTDVHQAVHFECDLDDAQWRPEDSAPVYSRWWCRRPHLLRNVAETAVRSTIRRTGARGYCGPLFRERMPKMEGDFTLISAPIASGVAKVVFGKHDFRDRNRIWPEHLSDDDDGDRPKPVDLEFSDDEEFGRPFAASVIWMT